MLKLEQNWGVPYEKGARLNKSINETNKWMYLMNLEQNWGVPYEKGARLNKRTNPTVVGRGSVITD